MEEKVGTIYKTGTTFFDMFLKTTFLKILLGGPLVQALLG